MSALREIGLRIGFASIAGIIVGAVDLWVYEFSVRGFLAGLAAGVVYYVIAVLFFVPGMQRFPWVLFVLAIVAGSAAGTAWWLVCRGSRFWVALVVGSVLALAHFASGGLFSRK